MAALTQDVMRALEQMAMTPSVQKYAVGPLVRLGVSPILFALVGRPKVLAATCARTHSTGHAVCSANLYIRCESRLAVFDSAEKVDRTIRRGCKSGGRILIVIFAATVMSLTLRTLRTQQPCCTEAPLLSGPTSVYNGDSLLGEICKCGKNDAWNF